MNESWKPPVLIDVAAQRARLEAIQSSYEISLKNAVLHSHSMPATISQTKGTKVLHSIQDIQLTGVNAGTHTRYAYSYNLLIPEGEDKGTYAQSGTFDVSKY